MEPSQANPFYSVLAAVISSAGSVAVTIFIAKMRARRREKSVLTQLVADVKAIRDQVNPNGGTSMRDSITRIEEQQLVDGEMRRAYQHYVNVPFWEADPHGMILWANGAFAKLLGVATEDLKGEGWMGMIHESDLYEVKDRIGKEVAHDQHLEFRVYRPNKQTPLKIKTRWRRVANHAGKTVRYVGTVMSHEEVK